MWFYTLLSLLPLSVSLSLPLLLSPSVPPPSQGGLDSDSDSAAESSGLFPSETDGEMKASRVAGSSAGEGLMLS